MRNPHGVVPVQERVVAPAHPPFRSVRITPDWPGWALCCLARADDTSSGERVAIVRSGTDALHQPRFRLVSDAATGARDTVAVCRHDPARTVHQTVSGWVAAARCADRGMGLGVVNAVVRGESVDSPCERVGGWIEQVARRWVREECDALLRAARWALAVDRWAETAAICRLVREGSGVVSPRLDHVERAVAARRRAAAADVGVMTDVLFRSGSDRPGTSLENRYGARQGGPSVD